MCVISLKDRRTNEDLKKLLGVESITTIISSGGLRRYGEENIGPGWKCMHIRVEGKIPVGRPRKTLVDNVEADMAELKTPIAGKH